MRGINKSYALEGSFETGNNFKSVCNNQGLTHNRRLNDLDEIRFTWKAPAADKGPLQLWFTLVQNFSVYWIQQKSIEITYVMLKNLIFFSLYIFHKYSYEMDKNCKI